MNEAQQSESQHQDLKNLCGADPGFWSGKACSLGGVKINWAKQWWGKFVLICFELCDTWDVSSVFLVKPFLPSNNDSLIPTHPLTSPTPLTNPLHFQLAKIYDGKRCSRTPAPPSSKPKARLGNTFKARGLHLLIRWLHPPY